MNVHDKQATIYDKTILLPCSVYQIQTGKKSTYSNSWQIDNKEPNLVK